MQITQKQQPSRAAELLTNEKEIMSKPKKKVKKQKENPFEDLRMYDQDEAKSQNSIEKEWIKPKTTPLTITITDHSKINKYYGHKSIQKYIQYLYAKSCPNPLWLAIKRQSQVEHIIFIDIEIENNLFHRHFNPENLKNLQKQGILHFLIKYNKPQLKAVFKETKFMKDSADLYDIMLVYDHEAIKNEVNFVARNVELPQKLTEEILKLYQTYILTEEQMKYNLYPMPQFPAYKDYYYIQQQKEIELKNKILTLDCEMVMCGNSFELARASIMNFEGQLIYDQFFKPDLQITNYNTQYSGITEETLKNATKKIDHLHKDMQNIIDKNTILIGHSLENDLHAMRMIHKKVIDTSVLFARKNGSKMKLKTLAFNILSRHIQVNSHCSQEDCKATLDLVRQKIQASQGLSGDQNKNYHLLDELIEQNKKIVFIDSDMDFVKHKKQYLGIQFQEIEYNKQNRNSYIGKFAKFLDKNVKIPDIIFSKMRKIGQTEEWEEYYQNVDSTIEQIYQKSPDKTVFFLNFQVNNNIEIYPQQHTNILLRRRPFCLIIVKSQ